MGARTIRRRSAALHPTAGRRLRATPPNPRKLSANVLFLYLINNLGSVFTGQAAYFTTVAGIGWSIVLLGESLNAWIWASLVFMAAGLFLVGPKSEAEAEPPPSLDAREARQT